MGAEPATPDWVTCGAKMAKIWVRDYALGTNGQALSEKRWVPVAKAPKLFLPRS